MIAAIALFAAARPAKLIMAHYMPWFAAPPTHSYGWHWTMNHADPAKGKLASHYHPLVGPYDSTDPDAVEYELLTMKEAGIDGIFVDWYGIEKAADYPYNQLGTIAAFNEAKKLGMKFGIVYEDQTVKHEVDDGLFPSDQAVAKGRAAIDWLRQNWFSSPNYVRLDGKPVLLVFGPKYFKPEQWPRVLGDGVSFFTIQMRREPAATGAFDWPLPNGGAAACEKQRLAFLDRAKGYPAFISAAYPRFDDWYREGGVNDVHDPVADADGQTFRHTLEEALTGDAPIVQLVTWNDWGEGTQIEPSKEFGYRDLEVVQQMRRKYVEPGFNRSKADLRRPAPLFARRKAGRQGKNELDRQAEQLAKGKSANSL